VQRHCIVSLFIVPKVSEFIGIGTIVNKIGKFCKVIDENKKDSFKNG
jgi:hypothetical protein